MTLKKLWSRHLSETVEGHPPLIPQNVSLSFPDVTPAPFIPLDNLFIRFERWTLRFATLYLNYYLTKTPSPKAQSRSRGPRTTRAVVASSAIRIDLMKTDCVTWQDSVTFSFLIWALIVARWTQRYRLPCRNSGRF